MKHLQKFLPKPRILHNSYQVRAASWPVSTCKKSQGCDDALGMWTQKQVVSANLWARSGCTGSLPRVFPLMVLSGASMPTLEMDTSRSHIAKHQACSMLHISTSLDNALGYSYPKVALEKCFGWNLGALEIHPYWSQWQILSPLFLWQNRKIYTSEIKMKVAAAS